MIISRIYTSESCVSYFYFAVIANILLPDMLAVTSLFCNQAHWAHSIPLVAWVVLVFIRIDRTVIEVQAICVRTREECA